MYCSRDIGLYEMTVTVLICLKQTNHGHLSIDHFSDICPLRPRNTGTHPPAVHHPHWNLTTPGISASRPAETGRKYH